ncbi:copper chaperone PCu(A)C [Acetobacter thailandicus]|nr:copper chaperone PCu(A)C [Acetobacter thailandicus]MBS0985150.1 copper chaperone PCu(A)C [Acetobacter thailandicus]
MLVWPGVAAAAQSLENLPGQEDAQKDILIKDASFALVGNPPAGVIYFTIQNTGDAAHLVTNVTSPACARLIGHHSDQESTPGTINLFHNLSLPAHSSLVFPVGGYHLVCLDMPEKFLSAQNISLTFSFLGGSSKTIVAPVAKSAASQ